MLDDGRRVQARAVVIATGSQAQIPEPFRDLGPRILTNETIFELPDLPDSLAVIGGGPIGLELAQAMGRLGVPVTLFDLGTRLGKARCDVVHDALKDAIARDVTLCLGVERRQPRPLTAGSSCPGRGTRRGIRCSATCWSPSAVRPT